MPFWGVSIIRPIAYRGLYRGSLLWPNHQSLVGKCKIPRGLKVEGLGSRV